MNLTNSMTPVVQKSLRQGRKGTDKNKFCRIVPFKDALNLILKVAEGQPLSQTIRVNLPAIISHWLQSPENSPLVLGKAVTRSWNQILRVCWLDVLRKNGSPELYRKAVEAEVKIDFSDFPFPPVENPKFTFVDLFAGIGGFRLAHQSLGGKCVFSSEWERNAQQTYLQNFGEVPFGDIREFTHPGVSDRRIKKLIPDHDILAAGFPCQPFSKAGVSSRMALGQKHGFSCSIQGTLFFDVARIVKVKQPKVLILENVRNLLWHNKGRTFEKIKKVIEDDLGYSFSSHVIDASSLVPQRRLRCYMVCYRDPDIKFSFPSINGPAIPLSSILEPSPDQRYTISDRLWKGHKRRTRKNIKRGTGFTAFLADTTKPAKTLVARYYKDGKECLIPQSEGNPRKLTPRECARLQGFPEEFIPSSIDSCAYRQFGNSVPIPVVETIAERILEDMKNIR